MHRQSVPNHGKSFHYSRLKIFLLFLQLLIVIAIAEHFIRRAMRQSEQAAQHDHSADFWQNGLPLPVLGEKAILPPGLAEAVPAFMPSADGMNAGASDCMKRQLDYATANGLPVEVTNSIGMHFRLIPPGRVLIGSPPEEKGHDAVESRHSMDIQKPFYAGMTEVTQAQWRMVMGNTACPAHFIGDTLPVEEVTWNQCKEFVQRLNEMELLPPETYRLPTEFQWEYACRSDSESAFCFGNSPRTLRQWAVFDENSAGHTSPVAQKRPNAFGLHDMHGNVWEWCENLYANYPGDTTPASAAHSFRVIRGGNWYLPADECRSAVRSRLPASSHGNMLGFRIIRILH